MRRIAAGMDLKRMLLGFLLIFGTALAACGGGGSSSPSNTAPLTGVMSVSFTDGPGDYDHVWITVKDVWFNLADTAGGAESDWLKFPLAAPVTVDLVALGDGASPQSLWNNLTLPVGTYKQIRLFLEPTFAANPPAKHSYFNEVVIGPNTFPLRIPDAEHGIKLVGAFQVTNGGSLSLALDFDAGDDIVDFRGTEYVLKPRLRYFDLADVGAIVGQIDATAAGNNAAARFVFKAEQLDAGGGRHVVRRYSTLSDSTGKFVIYPIPSGTYDLLLRGIGYETVIIKNVPVTKGTTPASSPTTVPAITMTPGTDYTATGSIASPTGAWVNFYQTLTGAGEVPYEVRFRHFNPITGQFAGFKLSNSPIQVGTYGASITLTSDNTADGVGVYKAVANAILYDASAPVSVTQGAPAAAFTTLNVTSPWTGHSISGNIVIPAAATGKMDRGFVFAVHGGMIVNALNVNGDMGAGGAYSLSNIPGGQPAAFFGVDAFGWSSTDPAIRGIGIPAFVDLRAGDATGADINMVVP